MYTQQPSSTHINKNSFVESCGFCALVFGRAFSITSFSIICTKSEGKEPPSNSVINGRNQAQCYTHPVELQALTYLTDFIVANLSARNWIRNELKDKVSINVYSINYIVILFWLPFFSFFLFKLNIIQPITCESIRIRTISISNLFIFHSNRMAFKQKLCLSFFFLGFDNCMYILYA